MGPGIAFLHLIDFSAVQGVPGHVVMAKHHSLGVACSAGGEDKSAALVDGDALEPVLQDLLLLLPAPAQQVCPAQHPWVGGHTTILNHLNIQALATTQD